MTWWGSVYLLVFGALSVAGILDDRSDGRSRVYLIWGTLAGIAALVLFVAYFEPVVATALGLGALPLPLLVLSATFEATSAVRDLSAARSSTSEERKLIPWGVLIALLLYTPAFAVGCVVARRALGLWVVQ